MSYVNAYMRQRLTALSSFGVDSKASSLSPVNATLPNTPPLAAHKILEWWRDHSINRLFETVEVKQFSTLEISEHYSIPVVCDAAVRDKVRRGILPLVELSGVCAKDHPTIGAVGRAAFSAANAFVQGTEKAITVKNQFGTVKVMPPEWTETFWTSIQRWAIEVNSIGTRLAEEDRALSLILPDLKEGALETAQDIGDLAGKSAAFVGNVVGKAVGGATSGFFSEIDLFGAASFAALGYAVLVVL